MGSVLFDFDSTLVACESLEALCSDALSGEPERLRELERITNAGMDGSMSFEDSLRSRLEIARPTRAATLEMGRRLAATPTPGMPRLVADLQRAGHAVWIVSGGFREILLAMGTALGIPGDRIHGVVCRWGADGALVDLDPENGFVTSKVEGLRRLDPTLARPSVGVGDGATDLALRDAGFVERFVAYTEHARRPPVVAQADFEAANMAALTRILGTLLA